MALGPCLFWIYWLSKTKNTQLMTVSTETVRMAKIPTKEEPIRTLGFALHIIKLHNRCGKPFLIVWPTFPKVNFPCLISLDTWKRSHEAPMTLGVVSCNGVWMPNLRYKSQSQYSVWQEHVTVKFPRSFQSRQITNSFASEWITVTFIWNCGYDGISAVPSAFYVFQLISLPVY